MEIKYKVNVMMSRQETVEVIASSKDEALDMAEDIMSNRYTFDDIEADIMYSQKLNGMEVTAEYAENLDRTFIFRYTYRDGELVEEQLLGFYCGEPNKEATKLYSNGSTIIRYE